MRRIDHAFGALYSELVQRCLDATFTSDFSLEGRFVSTERKGRRYWYFDVSDGHGGKWRRYVGPADDRDIAGRIETFRDLKSDKRARRKLVSTLIREAGLPRPDAMAGDVTRALADAGLFRLRAVLVGTTAFGVYPALLGVRFRASMMGTGDVDFAQSHAISAAVGDGLPPILDVLRSVDPSFRDLPHAAEGRSSCRFRASSGFMVEFLTTNVGSADHDGRPAMMPALGGASAEPLRFMDFLIREPVRAVLLHGSGVSVLVPSPERFAIHKMIISFRRRVDDPGAKAFKDLAQAAALMGALVALRRSEELADAWIEAWDRGPAWRTALASGLAALEVETRRSIVEGVAQAVATLGRDPAICGFST